MRCRLARLQQPQYAALDLSKKPHPDVEERSEEHTSELQSHSDLHSFPTRRSSDLRLSRKRSANRWRAKCRDISTLGANRRRDGSTPRVRASLQRLCVVASLVCNSHNTLHSTCRRSRIQMSKRDRKSTRLNSSHTVIYTLSLHDALPI